MRVTFKSCMYASLGTLLALIGILIPALPARGALIPNALIVGDSISKLSTAYLQTQLLAAKTEVQANIFQALNADSDRAVRLIQQFYKPSDLIVVFDAGTNNNPRHPEVLARNLRKAARLVGDSCMVVPTLDKTASGLRNNANTNAVFEFAASRPGTQVPEWAGVVEMRPNLRFRPHGFHKNFPAANYRGRMLAEGLRGCVEFLSDRGKGSGPRPAPVWMAPVDRLHRQIQSLE